MPFGIVWNHEDKVVTKGSSLKMRRTSTSQETGLAGDRRQLEENLGSSTDWRWTILTVGVVILGYFATSLGLTFFQKDLISRLPFPITIVVGHLVLKFILSDASRQVWTSCTGEQRVVLSWSNYLSRVAMVAVVSALDIGLSQWSFEYITVAMYTMTKTTAVLFVLFFALLFRLEKKHWSLIVIVGMISFGLFLFVYRSTLFNLLGFSMALVASFLSGARWTLAQLIMQKGKLGLQNPIDFMYHIQPLMVLTILPFAAAFEGLGFAATEKAFRFQEWSTILNTAVLILFGGVLAFIMEVFEFFIITKASSLTLSIVGITKEICAILLDVYVNGTTLSAVNAIGAAICLSGITLHVIRKAVKQELTTPISPPGARRNRLPESSRRRHRRGRRDRDQHQRSDDYTLPLLSDESSSEGSDGDGAELYSRSTNSLVNSGYREFDDSFYLQDNRQWTSVRDSHLRLKDLTDEKSERPDEGEVPRVLRLAKEKMAVVLADIGLGSED